MDFVASFSGGKNSVLSIIKMVEKGHRLLAIIVTVQNDFSCVHKIEKSYFEKFADIFSCQIIYVDSSGDIYEQAFIDGLVKARKMGADICIFGDVNNLNSMSFNHLVCDRSGLIPHYPILNWTSKKVISEILDLGIIANIVNIRNDIEKKYLGRRIDKTFVEEFSKVYPNYDTCGNNGEYHTSVELSSIEDIVSKMSYQENKYFDNASTCFPKAPGVASICSEFISNRSYSINRGTYREAYDITSDIIDHREDILSLFGADKKLYECVLGRSATVSINTILFGNLKKGDHVIFDDRIHNSTWRVANRLKTIGVDVDYWKINNGMYKVNDLKHITQENTKMIFLTMVDNIVGSYIVDDIDDYNSFVSFVRENNIIYAGDGVQLILEREFSIDKLDIDIFVATSHIGMLSIEGLSYLIGKKSILESTEPLVYGGTGSQSNIEGMPCTLPDKFEAGSINTTAIFSAVRALSYINNRKVSCIVNKKHRLGKRLREGIKDIEGIKVLGKGSFCLLLSERGSNIDISEIMFTLDYQFNIKARVGIQCSKMANDHYDVNPGGIRFSIGYFNTDKQIEYLIDSIKKAIKII